METYRPSQPPLSRRILLHPALHFALVFIVVFCTVFYIKHRESQTFLSRVQEIPKGPAVLSRNAQLDIPTPAPTATPTAAGAVTAAPTPGAAPAAATAGLTGTTATAPTANQPTNAATGAEARADRRGEIHLKVIYSEVDTTTLDRWVPRMQAAGQYSAMDFKMGVLPDIQKEISSDRSIINLDSVEKNFDASHPSHEWFVGKNTDNPVGFRTAVDLTDMDQNGSLRGTIKMIRMVDANDPRSFDADFELTPKAGWVFWDILPRQYHLDAEDEFNPKSFFQIFKSARFKSLRTQFTMFFIFDTPPNK